MRAGNAWLTARFRGPHGSALVEGRTSPAIMDSAEQTVSAVRSLAAGIELSAVTSDAVLNRYGVLTNRVSTDVRLESGS